MSHRAGGSAVVITVSDRSARGERPDSSGPVLVDGLRRFGWTADAPTVVPDDPETIRAAILDAVSGGADVVLTTGGTGLGPRDVTPEATAAIIERTAPGVGEALRAHGVANGIASAILSRGIAGVAGRTLIVNLPGSPGGVRDALAVLGPLLDHVRDQLRGGAHPPAGP